MLRHGLIDPTDPEVLEAMTDRVMSQWTLFRDPQVFGRNAKPVRSELLRSEIRTILEDALSSVTKTADSDDFVSPSRGR